MKKYIYILMIILVQGAALSFSGNGSGTEEDPYQITNVHQLQEMENNHTAYYTLMNNIDASETREWNYGDHDGNPNTPYRAMGFIPISFFRGVLNGNGKKIFELTINRPLESRIGMFSNLLFALITDLGIINSEITGKYSVGTLCGNIESSEIYRCYTKGIVKSIDTASSYAGYGIGGFCGYFMSNRIRNCYSYCTVLTKKKQDDYFVSSFCTGFGIKNCYTTGEVISNSKASPFGIGADASNGSCFWDTETTGIPENKIFNANGRTTEEMMKQATYEAKGWDFENVWCIDEGNDYPKLRVFGDCPTTDVIDNKNELSLILFPNPATKMINITCKNTKHSYIKIDILNCVGTKIRDIVHSNSYQYYEMHESHDISDLSSGIYYIRLITNTNILVKKFIVIE